MILYRFLNAKYGLDSIEKHRLKVSHIMELNDPFEFFCFDLSNRKFRKALKKTKKEIAEEHGIICFSKTWTNPLLWSHYADKHKGICLGFEASRTLHPTKMEYVESRIDPSVMPSETSDENRKKKYWKGITNKLLRTKYKHWQYEEEYRIWVPLEEKINDLYYIGFEDAGLELKEVIVGCESEITRAQVSNAFGNLKGVKVFEARAAFKSFKVVKNKNDRLWR